MTDKVSLLFLLCILVILLCLFPILCYKRIFLEKEFAVMYSLIWSIVTMLQVINSIFAIQVFLVFSLFIVLVIVCTFIVAYFLKKYLKMLFSSLIEISFDENCTSKIFIFRDAISSHISKGYIIYVYNTEKLILYHSLDDVVLDRHRQIVSKLDKIEKHNIN